MTYDLGGVAVLSFTATDTAGNPANATTCTLTITQPDGTTAGPYTLTGTAGVYSYSFLTTQSGRHSYRFVASGTPGPGVGVGAYDDVFNVYGSPQTLISLADTKKLLRTGTSIFDDDLRFFNESVTAFIDKYCGPMIPRAVTERHPGNSRTLQLRQIPVYQPAGQPYKIVSITPVLTYGIPIDITQLDLDFNTGQLINKIGLPFYWGEYDISYWAGRPVTPPNVLMAAQVILKHMWAMERGGTRPSTTPGAADDVTVLWGFAIPNRALEMLEAHRTPAAIA